MKRCTLIIGALTLMLSLTFSVALASAANIKSIALLPINFNDKYLVNDEQDFVASSVRELVAKQLKARGYTVLIPDQPTGPRLHKADTTALAAKGYGTDAVMVVDINYIVDERIHPQPGFPTIYPDMYLHGETRVYKDGVQSPVYSKEVIGVGRTQSRVLITPVFEDITYAQQDFSKKLLKGFAL